MSKYIIRRIANKTVISQAGLNEMTDIVSTQVNHPANPFIDKALDPKGLIQGTGGMGLIEGRESINPEYGMFTGAPGEGSPKEFSMTAQERDYLNKHPKEKLQREQQLLETYLKSLQSNHLNQVIPKLEGFYAIYRKSPTAFALGKLQQEARMIRQLSPMDKQFLMTKPYWTLIKDIVK
jgi:hypothetical protein